MTEGVTPELPKVGDSQEHRIVYAESLHQVLSVEQHAILLSVVLCIIVLLRKEKYYIDIEGNERGK